MLEGYHIIEQWLALRFHNTKAVAALREKIKAEKILTEKEGFLEMLG